MASSFQWPYYGIHQLDIPADSISQPAMISYAGPNYQKNYPVRIDFTESADPEGHHNMIAGHAYEFSGTGVTGIDGVTFYIWPVNNSVIELYTDANLFYPYYFRATPFFGEAGVPDVAWEAGNTQGLATTPESAYYEDVPATYNVGPIVNPAVTVTATPDPEPGLYRRMIGNLKI